MSTQTEIDRLTTAKADLKTAIEAKGGTIAENATLDTYAQALNNASINISDVRGLQAALNEKAAEPTVVNATLETSGWTGNEPYTYGLIFSGSYFSATANGYVAVAQSATAGQRQAARDAMMSVTAQTADRLTITADGDKPAVDIPVTFTFLG